MKTILLIAILVSGLSMSTERKYTMLCLGDSYTIGESVEEQERFPMQAVELLNKEGIIFEKPLIIAKTGWTTDELATAIKEKNISGKFDYVTLLIGVNNEFRGRDVEEYRKEFASLLQTALNYCGNAPAHVFVLSIPDWGATPFGLKDPNHRSPEQIAKEIDVFNAINKEETLKVKANYVDITPISRQLEQHPEYVAGDGLQPSGGMYAEWGKLLAGELKILEGR
jgi:lysophospholipase L1-like esterase